MNAKRFAPWLVAHKAAAIALAVFILALLVVIASVVFGAVGPDNVLLFSMYKDGNTYVSVLSTTSRTIQNITKGGDWSDSASWSPDGKTIIYSGQPGLLKKAVWNGTPQRIPVGCTGGFFSRGDESPDGTKLAYESHNLNGESFVCVTTFTDRRNIFLGKGYSPSWSPDGQQLAFVSDDGWTSGHGIAIASADGQTIHDLPKGLFGEPHWTPDGKLIVKTVTNDAYEIALVDPVRATVTLLTHEGGAILLPTLSPDGSRVAYISNHEGSFYIYVMNADGTHKRKLSDMKPDTSQAPAWSPDGTQIAFLSDQSIYVIDLASGAATRLTVPGSYEGLSWQPKSR